MPISSQYDAFSETVYFDALLEIEKKVYRDHRLIRILRIDCSLERKKLGLDLMMHDIFFLLRRPIVLDKEVCFKQPQKLKKRVQYLPLFSSKLLR